MMSPLHEAQGSIIVRRAERGDQTACLTLLGEYLGSLGQGDDAARRHAWLYQDNPHGEALTYLAVDPRSGAPVGLTSLFPRRVLVRGRERLGAIGGDGYVRPAYRRRGIARLLHRAALAGMAAGPVEFMYGPPEPHNLRALLGAGASLVGEVQRYSRPLVAALPGHPVPPAWLAPLIRRLLRPGRSRLRAVPLGPAPDPRVDRVFADVAAAGPEVIPVRDASFYAWRFARSPRGCQAPLLLLDGERPVAMAALERRDMRAAVVDLTCPSGALGRALAALLDLCRGVEAVDMQIHVPAPLLRRALLLRGFVPRRRKPFQVQAAPDHPLRDALLRPDAWCYLWGDGDVDHVLS